MLCAVNRKKAHHIGTIRPSGIKVRKKSAPPTRIQKSDRVYNRKAVKRRDARDIPDAEDISSDHE